MTNLLTVINSNPSLAAEAFKNLYHGKTFAIGRPNGHIDTFKKTLRGAEGYIKREQSGSYYDEYTNDYVSYGCGMFAEEIKEADILNPAESIQLWFNYLRDIQGHDYLYNQALKTAEYLAVNDEVMNYVVSAIDDMKNNRGLTVIEEVVATQETEQTEVIEEVSVIVESELNETIEATYQINNDKNGVEIYFTDKPSEEVRNLLKAHSFRWSKYSKCWYAKQSEDTINLAERLSNQSDNDEQETNEVTETISQIEYPEINIDDNDNYTIPQNIQDAEHDGHWLFRNNKIDHNKEIEQYFTQLTNEVKQIIQTTENEYIIYKLKKTLQYYKKHYHQNYLARLTVKVNSPSWVVTGRAGRNASRDAKYNNRYDKLMYEYIELDKDYKNRIESLKSKIYNEKKAAIRSNIENTNVTIEFKTETKEFTYMGIKEKKRVYAYDDYFICKLWNCFRLFHNGNEININLKTTDTLETAKKALTMYIQQQTESQAS